MKKALLICLALFAFAASAYSQSFTFTRVGPDTTHLSYDHYESVGKVTNTGTSNINIRFVRTQNSIPSGWTSSICYGLCYADFIDTVPMNNQPPVTIAAGTFDTMNVTWYSPYNGVGTVKIRAINVNNPSQFAEANFYGMGRTTAITPISSIVKGFELKQNYPNPFNPTTNINFSIPKSQNVSLKIYDMMGREVAELVNQFMQAGEYKADFSAANLSSGVYYYALKTDEFTSTKSMMLVK